MNFFRIFKKFLLIGAAVFGFLFILGLSISFIVFNKDFQKQFVSQLQTSFPTTTLFRNLETSSNSNNLNSSNDYFSETQDFQAKLNNEYLKITKNLLPDDKKSLTQYQKEIDSISKEFSKKIKITKETKLEEIDSEIFIKLAEKLASIKPPSIFYQAHLEFIKSYLTIGLALEEAKKTDDLTKKNIFYNIILNVVQKIVEIR